MGFPDQQKSWSVPLFWGEWRTPFYGDFDICFEIYVYFLASEDDKWVFLTSKNHGQSLFFGGNGEHLFLEAYKHKENNIHMICIIIIM